MLDDDMDMQEIKEYEERQLDDLSSSVHDALNIRWEQIVGFIPAPTAIVDEDSVIKFSNSLFNKEFFYHKHEKKLDSMFIEKEGYIYRDEILDWKDLVLSCDQAKVLIKHNSVEHKYVVAIAKIDFASLYVVSFYIIEDELLL